MTEKLLVMTEEGKKAFLVKPQALLVDAMQDNTKNLVEGTQADIACYEAVFAAMTEVDAKQLYAWVHAYDLAWLKWHADNERFGDMTAEPQWSDYLLAHVKEAPND